MQEIVIQYLEKFINPQSKIMLIYCLHKADGVGHFGKTSPNQNSRVHSQAGCTGNKTFVYADQIPV